MSTAQQIVKDIIEDLSDRRGLRHEWEQIDDDVKVDIVSTWEAIVQAHLDAMPPEPRQ